MRAAVSGRSRAIRQALAVKGYWTSALIHMAVSLPRRVGNLPGCCLVRAYAIHDNVMLEQGRVKPFG